jgi:glyoxylase-like metal-dependent hydrolase (beta-lactamase superfamily II)
MHDALRLHRRRLLALSGAAAAGLALPAHFARAEAPPQLGTQVPGWYRFKVGEFEVTVLSDGETAIRPPGSVYPDAPADRVEALLAAAHLPTDQLTIQYNVLVVNTGRHLVLIDAGSGHRFQPGLGRAPAQLAAAGIDPATIDTILVTHAHPDHLWGTIDEAGTGAAFGDTPIHLGEPEHRFWTDAGLPSRVPEAIRPLVEGTQGFLRVLGPRVQLVQPGAEIVPGITSIATPGHTPGHLSLRLASGAAQLVVLAHSPVLQLPNPDWHFGFDTDPVQAVATRKQVLDMLAADDVLVAAYHFAWPGLGHVVRDGAAYRWAPAPITWQL